jgi:hypothetical protein
MGRDLTAPGLRDRGPTGRRLKGRSHSASAQAALAPAASDRAADSAAALAARVRAARDPAAALAASAQGADSAARARAARDPAADSAARDRAARDPAAALAAHDPTILTPRRSIATPRPRSVTPRRENGSPGLRGLRAPLGTPARARAARAPAVDSAARARPAHDLRAGLTALIQTVALGARVEAALARAREASTARVVKGASPAHAPAVLAARAPVAHAPAGSAARARIASVPSAVVSASGSARTSWALNARPDPSPPTTTSLTCRPR